MKSLLLNWSSSGRIKMMMRRSVRLTDCSKLYSNWSRPLGFAQKLKTSRQKRRLCDSSKFKPPQGPVPPDKDPKLIHLLGKTALGVIVVVLGGRVFFMTARGISVGLVNPYSAGLALALGASLYGAYRGGYLPKYRPWMPRALTVGIISSVLAAVTIRDVEQSNVQMLRKASLLALETKGEEGCVWHITDYGTPCIEYDKSMLSQRLVLRMSARVTHPTFTCPQKYKIEVTATRSYPIFSDWTLQNLSLLSMSEDLSL